MLYHARWMLGWFDMYARWMLGWFDMYARCMLGFMMWDYSMFGFEIWWDAMMIRHVC